jgi:glycosyltransferase involved in cell wall biosynthesis
MCDLDTHEYGPQFIDLKEDLSINLPEKFITVHSQTTQDPKNYDHLQSVVNRIRDMPIVQVGGKDDKALDGISLDLRGRTAWQSLVWVFKNASLHVGLDSAPMHVALYADTPSVILFGGTYARQGTWPEKQHLLTALEPKDRFGCPTSCHLITCVKKQANIGKCINNIPVDDVLNAIGEKIGNEHIVPPEPITLSAYCILRNGIEYGFPFEESIKAAAKVADEVVVVDGGSTDGTYDKVKELMCDLVQTGCKLSQHKWDLDNPTLFGDEKTYARRQCTGNYLVQFDADEVIHEPEPGALKKLINQHRDADVLDLPVINFYGDDKTIRVEPASWKWRISKNDPNIIHGVHAQARQMDENGRVVMDKKMSDGCEYIYANSMQIVEHKIVFPIEYHMKHIEAFKHPEKREEYAAYLKELIKSQCLVFHYSWRNLERKLKNSEFWENTWHAKNAWTHNIKSDIEQRLAEANDILVKIDFEHPLCLRR